VFFFQRNELPQFLRSMHEKMFFFVFFNVNWTFDFEIHLSVLFSQRIVKSVLVRQSRETID